ncbi:tetratricopeptide repeat protein [Deminuibacter soli]|uniref:Tetratricopeptide repeat-containing protein n=1 Tax=Deminuibacter soli TaxID=2291815 RepID=A0A3E1NI33_9BACT|nr:tetratricopeptide repeat protein [Deminuibacter soli]RFM27572.1 tetratricopeptide repeat-containing protein [Deminuibacter soli]
MNSKIRVGIAFALLLNAAQLNAQATKANEDPDADFKQAKELYQKAQYSLAYPLFKTLYDENNRTSSIPVTIQVESKYYAIACGLKLDDATAAKAAVEFIDLEHYAPRIQLLCFELGEYYFRKQDYVAANTYYEKAGFDNLSNRQIADMKFHQAYGYFTMQRFNDAIPLFNAIRQIPADPNYIDANYYYGFICFYQKNYKEALTAFRVVENQPNYKTIVPYYVTEIYYFNGDKDKAIEYGAAALGKGSQYYDVQLRQLVGHAWFEKKEYDKALPYLEQYVAHTEKVRREDLYELSYCYYEAGSWDKAISGFKELGGKEDSLAQNSMYLLADAYLKVNQKPSARSAFLFCALNSSNAVQKEISRFHYAKLSAELGYTDVAQTELQEFIANYPKSAYNNEAKELLVSVLANTNNYKDALSLAQNVGLDRESVKKVYPRILYGRSVELINDQQILQADELLTKIFNAPYNTQQLPLAYFWKGEIAYRTGNIDGAVGYLQNYMTNAVTAGEVNVTDARYALGYCYLRQENYPAALQQFESIATSVSAASTGIQQDAFVRGADCYFMLKKYSKAQQLYDVVISNNLAAADYALYQKAVIAGAANHFSEKINLMQSVAQRYPSSGLIADANLEIANTHIASENFDAAIAPLNKVLADPKASSIKPEAYLKLGVAYFNLNKNDEALANFKKLVAAYPNSPESDAAVDYVRNIFISEQKTGEFVSFMRQNGKNVSYSEEDSLTYAAALIPYNNNDQATALQTLESYTTKFPDGRYALDANFQVAELYNTRKDFVNALKHYEAVNAKAPNKYAEQSVLQTARIYYFEKKDYAKAEELFKQLRGIANQQDNKLESMRGLLRCQYKLGQFTDAAPNAQELLQQKGIATDDKMMANMVIAKTSQLNNQLDEAATAYKNVVSLGKSEYAAEARYRIAEIFNTQGKLKEAEKAGFEVINKAGSYDFWITKAYILLGDVYFKEKDYFNAEATLKSVAENATTPELKQEAQQKLDAVVAEKNKNSKVVQQ